MKFLASLIIVSLGFWACQTAPNLNDRVERMVVQTTYDENTDFGFYTTYTLALDTLGLYANYTEDTILIDEVKGQGYVNVVTNKIKSEMAAAGYTFVNKDQNPDLGFAATVYDNYNVYQQISAPTYYSGYYGFGYGGYYGPIVTTYEYASSTLAINLIDLKTPYPEGRKVIWKAFIGDIAQSNDPRNKVLEAIKQSFDQSPYLAKP